MANRSIDLLFSDISFGCREFGFIPRVWGDTDNEDATYERYVRNKTGDRCWRVVEGVLYRMPPR